MSCFYMSLIALAGLQQIAKLFYDGPSSFIDETFENALVSLRRRNLFFLMNGLVHKNWHTQYINSL